MTNQTEALAEMRKALVELLDATEAPFPSADCGTEAQQAWSHRRSAAVGAAHKALAHRPHGAALSSQPPAPRDAAYEECAKLCEEIARRKGEKFFGQIVSDGSAAQCARAIRAAAVQTDDAAALELEHFGDPEKGTGIYASLTGTAGRTP